MAYILNYWYSGGVSPNRRKFRRVFSKLSIPVKKSPIFIANQPDILAPNRPLAMVDFIEVDRQVSTQAV
jgi:hypothetical protein